jgi:hypothetical protein
VAKRSSLLLLVFAFNVLLAQKHDYNWLFGYRSFGFAGTDSVSGLTWGHTIFDFNDTPKQVNYDSLKMNISQTLVSFSDSLGELLFYTNGVSANNGIDDIIQNGDSLNYGLYTEWEPLVAVYGYPIEQGILALPCQVPGYSYLLHSYIDTLHYPPPTEFKFLCRKVLLTTVNMNANAGLGEVISKNVPVVEGVCGGDIASTKHGNGRDWWVLVQKRSTGCFWRILVDSTGAHIQIDSTCGAPTMPNDDKGASAFSPDGTKYAYLSYFTGLTLFDFDRCTGTLSNAVNLPLPILSSAGWQRLGVSFSPSSRFVYTSVSFEVYQFDSWAPDVFAAIDTIAIYDGTNAPNPTFFGNQQLAPDGKIYISSSNTNYVFDVIERPDEKGAACMFKPHSDTLKSLCSNVPYFPNYRLGAWGNGLCDSLTGLNEQARAEKERVIKVHPNPAADYVIVDYGFTDWSKGDVTLEIVSSAGQLQYQQQLPLYSGLQKISVKDFSTGAYTVYLKRNNQVVATTRFVKE